MRHVGQIHALGCLLIAGLGFALGRWWFADALSPAPRTALLSMQQFEPAPVADETTSAQPISTPEIAPQSKATASANDATPVGTAPVDTSEPIVDTSPFPSVDVPIHAVFETYRQRAANGDKRAACWLGRRLQECGSLYDRRDAMLRQMASNLNAVAGDSHASTRLGVDQLRLDAMQRCEGLLESDLRDAYPLLRQAAEAGSVDALVSLIDPRGALGPGMPNPVHFRQMVRDQPQLMWAAVQAGSPEAFEQLYYLVVTDQSVVAPLAFRQARLTIEQRQVLLGVLQSVQAHLRSQHPELGGRASMLNLPVRIPPELLSSTPRQRVLIDRLAAEVIAKGWLDAERSRASLQQKPRLSSRADCERFTKPVNLDQDLTRVLTP